jgi:hypothetical protein
MNLLDIRTRVLKRLGNLPTDDPQISPYLDDIINQAANEVVLRRVRSDQSDQAKLNLFPELRHRWLLQATEDDGGIALPEDLLILEDVYSYDTESAPDEDEVSRRLLTPITERQWELAKRTDVADWPAQWAQVDDEVKLLPVPREDYLTYVQLSGWKLNEPMVDDADEPTLKARWHPTVVDVAVELAADHLDWPELRDSARSSADKRLSQVVSTAAIQNATKHVKVRIKGWPYG